MSPVQYKDEDGHVWHKRCMGWLGRLSHDLRNQLAPMRTAAQLLLSKRLDPSRQDEMLETIDRQIQRMVRMIDDLSEFGRLQTGVTEVRRDPLDIAMLIDAALSHCGDRIRASGLQLVRDVPDRPLMIEGDQNALIQTLIRLLDNALKATSAPGTITVSVAVDGNWVDTRIIDTGRGLSTEQIDAIFSLPDGPRSAGSLGISLLLARAAAEKHAGELRARSEGEARGSEFVLRLPLSNRQ